MTEVRGALDLMTTQIEKQKTIRFFSPTERPPPSTKEKGCSSFRAPRSSSRTARGRQMVTLDAQTAKELGVMRAFWEAKR